MFFLRFEKRPSVLGGHSAFTVCCLHAQVWERQSGAAQPDPVPGDPPTLQHSGAGARLAQLPEVWEHGQVSPRLPGIKPPLRLVEVCSIYIQHEWQDVCGWRYAWPRCLYINVKVYFFLERGAENQIQYVRTMRGSSGQNWHSSQLV